MDIDVPVFSLKPIISFPQSLEISFSTDSYLHTCLLIFLILYTGFLFTIRHIISLYL